MFTLRLQHFRDEVQARGPAIDDLLTQYRSLTQHNPSLADPVIRAVRDDWEELLGQIENLMSARDSARQSARELQSMQDTMDEDLENYARELERIDKAETTMEEKGVQMQVGTFDLFSCSFFSPHALTISRHDNVLFKENHPHPHRRISPFKSKKT